ncbi:MAG: tetratricopeptide repeat protein [Pseudomonadota bacterium]
MSPVRLLLLLPLLVIGIAAYSLIEADERLPTPAAMTNVAISRQTMGPLPLAIAADAAAESASSVTLESEPLRVLADEGARLFAARRFVEAAEKLLPAAEAGYPQAQYQVGWMHYLGFGLQRDLEAAVSWFARAAEQGNVDGMNALGTALREGKGTGQDHGQALHWYRAAAEQGHPDGEVNLGFMLEMGYGTEQDLPAAALNYRLAAEKNHATAQFYLGSLHEEGNGVAADLDTARGWYRRAAAQGNEYARLALQRLEGLAPAPAANPAASWPGER